MRVFLINIQKETSVCWCHMETMLFCSSSTYPFCANILFFIFLYNTVFVSFSFYNNTCCYSMMCLVDSFLFHLYILLSIMVWVSNVAETSGFDTPEEFIYYNGCIRVVSNLLICLIILITTSKL